MGFEPTVFGLKVRCLDHLATRAGPVYYVARNRVMASERAVARRPYPLPE